ncbi:MAG: hypothetical protein QOK40_3731 [Miltoncostaeaceae bacterium]|jgi:hypothetical protein|nr:hypothetical protein [Miltoncostaeaceae bacterium]
MNHELTNEELEAQSLELLPDREAMLFILIKLRLRLIICL